MRRREPAKNWPSVGVCAYMHVIQCGCMKAAHSNDDYGVCAAVSSARFCAVRRPHSFFFTVIISHCVHRSVYIYHINPNTQRLRVMVVKVNRNIPM